MKLYSGTVVSKTGELVPLFFDGKPMHSKYNPAGEGASFAKQSTGGFIVVAGIGGGFHLEALLSSIDGDSFILALESDSESLDFCRGLPKIKELEKSEKIALCSTENFCSELERRYFPAAYTSFSFIAHRAWEDHAQTICSGIKKMVQKKIDSLSGDFSVQSHFGKIWQRNILVNARSLDGAFPDRIDPEKTAAIVAAGPSLDTSIEKIIKNPDGYTVFSTDTAYGVLISHGIIPDYVVSIDGQAVSSSHFYIDDGMEKKSTTFVFDLCANPSAVQIAMGRGFRTIFIRSHHPLCSAIYGDFGPASVESGSGTVTIAACDLARQLGAKKIRVFGADFSYCGGKPYCRGTYLDTNFNSTSTRLTNLETKHSALMFRTELFKSDVESLFGDRLIRPMTSPVMQSFRKTFLLWCEKYGYKFNGGTLENQHNSCYVNDRTGDQKLSQWIGRLEPIFKEGGLTVPASVLTKNTDLYPLFPYAAWLRARTEYNKVSFFELLKLAYSQLRRYTCVYEK